MAHFNVAESDYLTQNELGRRMRLANDPYLGEIYHNMMEDYRWWGHESRYSNFKSYFETIRYREMRRLYTRYPFKEFMMSIEAPGEKEAWTVLPHADLQGNTATAYPPGMMPPQYANPDSLDALPKNPYESQVKLEGRVDRFIRDTVKPHEWWESDYLDEMEAYMDRIDEVHGPYARGEAIVPDVTTRIEKPIPMKGTPLSIYAALDQVAVDSLFSKPPYADMNQEERSIAPVAPEHLARAYSSRIPDLAADFGEKVALRQLYERAIYIHHVATMVALEKGLAAPAPPLPDPRLDEGSIHFARERFIDRLATLSYLSRPRSVENMPALERQQYQAIVGAYVVAGQESGFLPADFEKLPKIFQEAVDRLRRAEFILERDKALKLADKGYEETLRLRAQTLATADSKQHVRVHWSGHEAEYARVEKIEPWERIRTTTDPLPAASNLSSAADSTAAASVNAPSDSSAPSSSFASPASTAPTAPTASSASSDLSAAPATPASIDSSAPIDSIDSNAAADSTLATAYEDALLQKLESSKSVQAEALDIFKAASAEIEASAAQVEASTAQAEAFSATESTIESLPTDKTTYYSAVTGQFDWHSFNKDAYHEGMSLAEFDVACEAMLRAVDLQFQAANAKLAAESDPLYVAQESAPLDTPLERMEKRSELISSKLAEYDAVNPRPELPDRITRANYEGYKKKMAEWLDSREKNMDRILKDNPISLPPMNDILSAMGMAEENPKTGELSVATWGQVMAEEAATSRNEFLSDFMDLLQRDVAATLTMDELEAFSILHESKLGILGLGSSKKHMKATFIEHFRPFSSYTNEEILERYGTVDLMYGTAKSADRRFRAVRADQLKSSMLRSFESFQNLSVPLKSTLDLEKERRESVRDQRLILHESLLMKTDEEATQLHEEFTRLSKHAKSHFELQTQYRNFAAAITDVEFKYSRERVMDGPPKHFPLPKAVQPAAAAITLLERIFYKMPQLYIYRFGSWLNNTFGFEQSWMARRLVRHYGLDLLRPATLDIPLDPKTAHIYHPYYRTVIYRLYYFLHAPETKNLNAQARAAATSPFLPSWSVWHFRRIQSDILRRLRGFVSTPFRLFMIPFAAMTTIATVSVLEQRKTWAHDLIRSRPEGLEFSPRDRRLWMQRNLKMRPWARWGPTSWVPHHSLDYLNEYQDAPYLHRANSSNAADFKIIGSP